MTAHTGAIYHHFRDKTDLIERCYARGFDIYDLIMETGVTTGSTPLERSAHWARPSVSVQVRS